MKAEVKRRRKYDTTLRNQQALLTRQRVLDAARRLFARRNYPDVTMQDVADEAGVAYQTVYSQFRTKLQLALELCTSEFPHVGQTVTMLVDAQAANDPAAWLQLMGPFCRRLYEPCVEVLRFMRQSGEPELLARYAEIQRGRLQLLSDLGPQLERMGKLKAGMSGAKAVDLVWSMSDPETYERFVIDRGWEPDEFERWLGPALTDLILNGKASSGQRKRARG